MAAFSPYSSDLLEIYINEPAINKSIRQIRYKASTLTGNNKVAWLLQAIRCIDLTTLNSDDTSSNVEELCKKAVKPIAKLPFECTPLHTAAVCVYPSRVTDAIFALQSIDKETEVKVASVAAGFPSGQYPLETRLEEVRYVLKSGAQEVDVVIDRSLALNHHWLELYKELVAIKSVCREYNDVHLKVILATGELFDLTDVYKASMLAMMAGADFIKTSTGKEAVNATLPVGIVMCRAIKRFYEESGTRVGFKPAGGIKSAQDALEWMVLMKEELGNTWLDKNYFRIGASSLLDNIIKEISASYQPC